MRNGTRSSLKTFPGVFSDIGEFTIHKEFVSAKIAGEVTSLQDKALDRLRDFAAEAGLVVFTHNDVDTPNAKEGSPPAYLDQVIVLFKRHPKATIIWAHIGVGAIGAVSGAAAGTAVAGSEKGEQLFMPASRYSSSDSNNHRRFRCHAEDSAGETDKQLGGNDREAQDETSSLTTRLKKSHSRLDHNDICDLARGRANVLRKERAICGEQQRIYDK